MNFKQYSKKISIAIASVFFLTAAFFAGVYVNAQKVNSVQKVSSVINKDLGKTSGIDFSEFWKVWSTLDDRFVQTHKVSASSTDQTRVDGAIKGMVDSLGDPYTIYLTPSENKDFESELSGSLEGVGMEVGVRNSDLVVISPLKGSPAEKAGILAGDKIIKIGDKVTSGINVSDAVNLIRGKKGTTVSFTLEREGKKDPVVISVVRDVINIPVIDTKKIESDKVFVITMYSFTSNSADLFRNALRDFVYSGYDKLVIDLRNNPGGYLEAAVDMASWFTPPGKVIVSEDFGKSKEKQDYLSYGYNIFNNNLKLVILTNEGSASASEIFAGALHEYGVATLVGEKTFGKGSVQELVPMDNGASLKVTIARWLTPKGNSISEEGLKPDFEVKMTDDDVKNKKDPQMDKAVEVLKKL